MKTLKYTDFPRKAKKAIKSNFLKTIRGGWKPKEVKISKLRWKKYGDKGDYKIWSVCEYTLG